MHGPPWPSAPGATAQCPGGALRQLQEDFARYRPLTAWQESAYRGFCARRRRACVTLRVVDGIPWVLDLFPGYQSRLRATLLAAHRALLRFGPVPDTEVVVDVTDGELQHVDLPVLVITHRVASPAGVLYPDFTFFSWPESACPPSEPSHAYEPLFAVFAGNWTHASNPWRNRSDTLFWRGARVDDGGNRQRAVAALTAAPGADARLLAWRATSPTGRNALPGCSGLLAQCRHRYLAFLAGTTYSSRLKYQLLCGSTVLAAEPIFAEWWTHLLHPGEHYAPVRPDFSDAPAVLAELRRRPQWAEALARSGQQLALTALSVPAVDCYWWQLLAQSAAALPPPPSGPPPPHARPLEDVLLWPPDVALSADFGGPVGGPPPQPVRPPPALRDPRCFSSAHPWAWCCDTEAFGPQGDARCWQRRPAGGPGDGPGGGPGGGLGDGPGGDPTGGRGGEWPADSAAEAPAAEAEAAAEVEADGDVGRLSFERCCLSEP